MFNKIFLILSITAMLVSISVLGQKIQGHVYELDELQQKVPLPGANVFWAGTTEGTATDAKGYFELNHHSQHIHELVISYIGYLNDTVEVGHSNDKLDIVMAENTTLAEVEVADRAPGAHVSRTDPILTQQITLGELRKAACCNLSESFETNASVDVNYSDAITGAKQIKLLGLAGKYSQIQTENIPNLRGLSSSYGLSYIPGSWMESIQVSKGTSSVKNGYESITGQINVEYKKPTNGEKLFLNFYANQAGRLEGNINSSIRVNDRWSTALFGHVSNQSTLIDHNGDGFIDDPVFTQVNLFNRWALHNDFMEGQFGVKYLMEERKGGQKEYFTNSEGPEAFYGTEIKTDRLEAFSKTGFFINSRPSTSIGWINSYIYHDMNSFFGNTIYDATEHNFYTNLMFQTYLFNTGHTITAGVSYMYDHYDEMLNDTVMKRMESVPGIFGEYSYNIHEKLTLMLGVRGDYHNVDGFFVTPRLHVRYAFSEHSILRASAGKGYRSADVIAENLSLLASSRQFVFKEQLKMENAWNYGLSYTQYVDILGREMSVTLEGYRTDFINQVIVDKEHTSEHIMVYNLDGNSYANTLQVEAKYELIPRLDLTLAFRYNDVQMTIGDSLMREPLVNRYKGLVTLSYATRMKKWQFDFTAQFNGDSRIPNTSYNPTEYQMPGQSPSYTILNAQITKYFKRWDIYLGGENLTNFKQQNPIIAWDDPYGPYFDASNVWGPIAGIKVYAGVRYTMK